MALNLAETFAVLTPALGVALEPVSPQIYAALDANYDHFKSHVLISVHASTSDWGMWERHPAGDEIVVLLSGAATMTLQHAHGRECVTLDTPGAFLVVPKNLWHTARISAPTRLLFITPGEGTENGPEPPGPTNPI